jgi:hypothetical protein
MSTDVLESPKPFLTRALPFNSETGRINQLKAAAARSAARKAAEPLRQLKFKATMEQRQLSAHSKPAWGELALMRRTLRRYLQWALAATKVDDGCALVSSAVDVFNMEQRLLGRDVLPTKSKSKKPKRTDLSPHDLPMPDPVDCGMAGTPPTENRTQLTQDASESGNRSVDTSKSFPASGQAVSAPLPQDDTPF